MLPRMSFGLAMPDGSAAALEPALADAYARAAVRYEQQHDDAIRQCERVIQGATP